MLVLPCEGGVEGAEFGSGDVDAGVDGDGEGDRELSCVEAVFVLASRDAKVAVRYKYACV